MARRATALFAEIEAGRIAVTLEDVVLAEVFWTLHSFYGNSREEVLALVEPLVALSGVLNPEKDALFHALVLLRDRRLDFADALLAAKALDDGSNAVLSFDRDFDRIPGLKRVEPA